MEKYNQNMSPTFPQNLGKKLDYHEHGLWEFFSKKKKKEKETEISILVCTKIVLNIVFTIKQLQFTV